MATSAAPLELSPAHQRAAARRRRIVVQYDALGMPPSPLTQTVDEWLAVGFQYLDQPGSQVDGIWWDCAYGNYAAYPSQVLPPSPHPVVQQWLRDGLDWPAIYCAQTHQRGLEAFWHHRIAEVDVGANGLEMHTVNPVKAAHPDWLIRTWWWQGLWNLAVPELRAYKLAILRELAENYDFDGFQIDFARHVPILPVGRQWELREHVTAFLRSVRQMLQEVAAQRGRPLLLAAKVPGNLAECRVDGLDVGAWTAERLVDLLTLGSRSFQVDVAEYRALVGPDVRLYPCLDDHHASDGYRHPPVEVFRGVAAAWYHEGADGVVTFNWHAAPPEVYTAHGAWPGPLSQQQAYLELGDGAALREADQLCPVERRGGYPWAEGAFNRNEGAPLPCPLRYDGTPAAIVLRAGDQPPADRALTLRAVISEAVPGDRFAATLNGRPLGEPDLDFAHRDPQILAPNSPEWASGRNSVYPVNPAQQLCRATWTVDPAALCPGRNAVTLAVAAQAPHCCRQLYLEKLELHVWRPGVA